MEFRLAATLAGGVGRREYAAAWPLTACGRATSPVAAPDALFSDHRVQIVTLARHYLVPTIYELRDFVVAGGLISYGAGISVGRILKGEELAPLPVMQPAKFEHVTNLKIAKALGLTIPPGVLAIADGGIE
jgi:putative tryptophan/tyrosine transport system substrate-binding protein